MASGVDGNGLEATPPECEGDHGRTELLEDLSAKLEVLQERMKLCDKILMDLVVLRNTMTNSNQKNATSKDLQDDAKTC
ncbi:hypothetical protein GN956_G4988 [Arapaima gigas]